MRLTTGTAALAVAGLAALATGCSSSSESAAPVVQHHVVKPAAAAAPAAKPLTARQQLAKAMRDSLAAHTVLFRFRETVVYVAPKNPVDEPGSAEDVNPSGSLSGVADFDHNRMVLNEVSGEHAAQPSAPGTMQLIEGTSVFSGFTSHLVNSEAWTRTSATVCQDVDSLVDVLSFTTGPITVRKNVSLNGESRFTLYQVKIDFGRALEDSCDADTRALGRNLRGKLARQDVWVNSDGLLSQMRLTVDPGSVHIAGVDPSEVKALVETLQLSNYGVKMVVPPHPTKV